MGEASGFMSTSSALFVVIVMEAYELMYQSPELSPALAIKAKPSISLALAMFEFSVTVFLF